jgi:hypothetical protein
MGMQVEDDGESECSSVMGETGVQNLPQHESVQTSIWSLIVRTIAKDPIPECSAIKRRIQ